MPRDILDMTGIDNHDGEAAWFQYIEYRLPVDSRTLHGYVRYA